MAKMKMPKKIGTAIDMLYTKKQERLAAKKVLEALQAEETMLKDFIIETLPKSETQGAQGKLARATITKTAVPTVEDWKKFHAYIKKHGRFDLLQRRVATGAITDMLDEGKKLPGIKTFNKLSVSLNKV